MVVSRTPCASVMFLAGPRSIWVHIPGVVCKIPLCFTLISHPLPEGITPAWVAVCCAVLPSPLHRTGPLCPTHPPTPRPALLPFTASTQPKTVPSPVPSRAPPRAGRRHGFQLLPPPGSPAPAPQVRATSPTSLPFHPAPRFVCWKVRRGGGRDSAGLGGCVSPRFPTPSQRGITPGWVAVCCAVLPSVFSWVGLLFLASCAL
jgi:hypothetical protein